MSDATEVGSIVAYLVLRREDWTAGVRSTEQEARRLGALNPRIRIDANTGEILAQLGLVHAAERKVGTEAKAAKPFVINMWAALAAVAPAAVPITAVAGGALLGLLPVMATVVLGVSGIKDEMKSGALQGTQYGKDIATAGKWLDQLKATAASGILDGVDRAIQQSRPLFGALNSDIGQISVQLGDVVAGAAPALLAILHQLEPLFATIGGDLAHGAAELEHWAQSSTGISKFVAYVQAELPEVEHLLGGVITLVGHLFEGAAGPGAALLHDLNLLVGALDRIPVGVIATAIPLAVSLYAALKTGQGVAAVVRGVSSAVEKVGAAAGISAVDTELAAARYQAAMAAEEAATAEATAVQLESYAAREQAAASWGAAANAEAAEVAAAARAEAVALAATAAEAQAAADTMIAAAAETAAASDAAGEAGAAGWSAMLGPVAAIGVGVALLSTLLLGNSDASQRAAEASSSYADSLKKTTDHLAKVNVQQTVDNLGKAHALTQLKSLQKGNADLGITFNDLTLAVNGSKDQYDSLLGKLDKIAQANFRSYTAGKVVVSGYSAQGRAAQDLAETVKTLRKGLDEQTKQQIALAAAEKQAQVIQDGGNAAVRRQADALHATSDAYLEAQQAAQKNTEQTRQQTLEMQLASDAAGLLNQALMTLAGQNLSVAQAQTSYGQALRGVLKSLHDNGGAIKGNSEKALANQQAVQGSVASARQLAQATAQQTHSNAKAIASYKESKRELEDQLAAHNKLTPALKRYIDRLFDVKGISDYLGKHPTKTDVNNGPAIAKIDRLEARIKAIRQGRVPGLDANTDAARTKIAELQAQIDALHGKTFTIGSHGLQFSNGQGGVIQRAAGGTVPGVGNTDSQPAMLMPGEEVISKGPATKNRALLKAINSGAVVAYARGGTVGSVYQVGSGYGFQGQYFSKKKDAEKAAADARHSAASQSIFDSTPGSDAWKAFLAAGTSLQQAAASSTATAADVRAAATNLLTAAKAAGLSHKALAAVAADERKLSADAARRESVLARLGTRPSAPTAYEQLAAAQDTFRSDRQKYAAAASGFDVTSVTGGSSTSRKIGAATITTTGTDLTAASILAADAADVAKIKEFDALIHRLVAEGFDQDYVAQIAAKGPSAIETARALVKSSPALVASFNRLEKGKGSRTALAGDLGTFLAKSYDQAGVDAAEHFVHGLVSQEKALTSEMLKLVSRVEKKLRIDVPVHATSGKRKKHGGKPKHHHPASDSGRGARVNVNVHAAPGQSETTIGRVAAAKVLWFLDR